MTKEVDTKHLLTTFARLVLESDIRAIGEIAEEDRIDGSRIRLPKNHASRLMLARTLGVEPEDLEEIVESVEEQFGPGTWESIILKERASMALDSSVIRSAGWDRIEALAVGKLARLVEMGAITTLADLKDIAIIANRANRNTSVPANRQPATVQMGVFVGGNQVAEGQLEAGELGTMKLSLSTRVIRQLEDQRKQTDELKVLRTAKMLDVQELRSIASGEDDESER